MTGKDILTCLQLVLPESKKLYMSSASHEGTSYMYMCIVPTNQPHHTTTGSSSSSLNHIVCVEELKMNLLAKSCLCPGISTMLCNLITTISTDGLTFEEKWKEEYASGCGFEIYRVPMSPCFQVCACIYIFTHKMQ